ncbi:MAG: AarF/ABC1/UbiB kinase family protein [Planctomycetes bacterium]|nr:AarF/ABC1/UbiB kinase family protein [Planctomycetota bacterium]
MPVTEVTRTIRNARRYVEILDVLVRYGFADAVTTLGLDNLVDKGTRLFRGAKATEPVAHLPRAARMRVVMEQLGPTFMKLGQMLSCRKDLIPAEWADEFAKLQAGAPTLDFAVIRGVLDEEFDGRVSDVLSHVEEAPIAAASMAQVHRATLVDGTPVVLKILRPGTEELTQSDLEILRTLAEFAQTHLANTGFSPADVVREFARELKREVDFTFEGRSTDRLREAFAEDPNVRFPKVYWEATTKRVLALEEFRGVLLSRLKPGDLTPEQCTQVVSHGADAVARQCLEIGLFHADPHPGNLFALVNEDGSVAAGFIDCGMTGRIEPRTMELLARLVRAVAEANTDEVIAVVSSLADVPYTKLDDRIFRADMAEFAQSFEGATVDQIDLPVLLESFFEKLRFHKIRFPAELVMLVKSLTTIQAVARSLDPEFDMISHLRPFVEQVLKRRYGATALKRRTAASMVEYASLMEDLPREIRMLMGMVRRNRLAVNLEHRGLAKVTRSLEHASRNISFGMMVAGVVVSSSILVHSSDRSGSATLRILGISGFVIAGLMILVHMFVNRKWLKEREKDKDT